jgi:hypothetical protein
MNPLSKRDWLLLLLLNKPLDRIRLMKALFLIWHRSGRTLENYYEFTPYMYGPCSFDLYAELDAAQQEHLVSQAPHSVAQWAAYYLTPKGASRAKAVQGIAPKEIVNLIQAVAEEVSSVGFHTLLRKVYAEAPDFASQSVLPWRPKQ